MISNRHRTKLVSLKHVVRWRLSLAFSIFITLRKTKLPVNAKKSRRNQSPREAACTEIFVFLRFGFLISQPSNLQNIFHYLVMSQETFTHGIEKFAINQYLELLFQGQTNIEKATSRLQTVEKRQCLARYCRA